MCCNLIGLGIKTGAAIYKNKKQTQILESQARLLHYEKMARGEIEYKGRILDTQDKGIKDEIVLCVVLLPVLILGWSVFSDDPLIRDKIDLFFTYFKNPSSTEYETENNPFSFLQNSKEIWFLWSLFILNL